MKENTTNEKSTEEILNNMGKSFEKQAKAMNEQNKKALQQVNQGLENNVNNSILPLFYNIATLFIVLSIIVVFIKVFMSDKDE